MGAGQSKKEQRVAARDGDTDSSTKQQVTLDVNIQQCGSHKAAGGRQ